MKKIALIGGGAAGMVCAIFLARQGHRVTVLERGQRLGRKLAATGNGQGNLTNVHMGAEHYFSDDNEKVARLLSRFGYEDAVRFFSELGGAYLPDSRGRVYPASRQASALTDLLRRELERLGVNVCLSAHVKAVSYDRDFAIEWENGHMNADAVVLAAGGKAAKHLGTDGSAYALATHFGHTMSAVSPVIVQLRCDPSAVRGLKGIRVEGEICVNGYRTRGDVLFTESGVSGDGIFRASSHCTAGDTLYLNFLPELTREQILLALEKGEGEEKLLCLVNNGLGRFLYKQAKSNEALCALLQRYPLQITGTLGFDYAQATRGGIPLSETDEHLQSTKRAGLYLAGEILNVDGECGGYNLQWAFTSAFAVAEGLK